MVVSLQKGRNNASVDVRTRNRGMFPGIFFFFRNHALQA